MKNVCTVSIKGKGGGLVVFWDECFSVELKKLVTILLTCIFVIVIDQNGDALLFMENRRQVKGMSCGSS